MCVVHMGNVCGVSIADVFFVAVDFYCERNPRKNLFVQLT